MGESIKRVSSLDGNQGCPCDRMVSVIQLVNEGGQLVREYVTNGVWGIMR